MGTASDVLRRLRAEFLEMPGLRLTSPQVERFCGIERQLCQALLDTLVETKFLCVTFNGVYARATDGEVSRARAANAGLRAATPSAKAS
jgi:hypothetical protein